MQIDNEDDENDNNNKKKSLILSTPIKKKIFYGSQKNMKCERFEYPVQYKFVEGYTNAVKRKVLVKDWL